MITFKNISRKFKNDFWSKSFYALTDVSFTLSEGDLVGFLGANGAGKTTLIKILMEFINPTDGKIIFDKKLGSNKQEIFSKLGHLPERPYFYPYLTGLEFLTYMGQLANVPSGEIKKQISYWSSKVNISHALDRKVRSYSKGMLQRLGLISTLIHKPQLLILDEPLSGLDPIGRKELKDIFLELNSQGVTIFLSSHIVADIEQICNKAVVLQKGRILYEGDIQSLLKKHIKSKLLLELQMPSFNDPPAYINIIHRQNDTYIVEVDPKDKNQLINETLSNNGEILSLNYQSPSLEQIIYEIGIKL
ncbi:MAG: ABC transporter ATP-binding protein [Bacteriovoracaceae bacterium]|nr:ABC transporter ATP-binding protein [Bacteriovoracaceae bacterium]